MSTQHVIFVYGTLQRGEGNHGLLLRSRLLGIGITQPRFDLVDVGGYPALVDGGSTAVRGEVYAVDDETLARLDELEGHPGYYERRSLELLDGVQAQTYVLPEHEARGCPRIESGDWRLHRLQNAAE